MFYLVDCVYRRFHTRSLVEINGILHITPNLAISILLMLIFFAGLPGTLKFTVEFYIFSGLLAVSPFICFFIMIVANVVGLIGFSKCWFNCVFGLHTKWLSFPIVDLTNRELFIIFSCFFYLVLFSYISFFII
jgi:NADH:ubiquinone oxidoreductase subunit 4 (subunit M)